MLLHPSVTQNKILMFENLEKKVTAVTDNFKLCTSNYYLNKNSNNNDKKQL